MSNLYFAISLSLKALADRNKVKLLNTITAVLYQKAFGISNETQLAWFRLTMYALVKPANIINILPIATHKVNLWGCILFLVTAATVFIFSPARRPVIKISLFYALTLSAYRLRKTIIR